MINAHYSQLLPREDFIISTQEYELFKREYVMYALADKRFGQAFCEKYNLFGTLYYFKDTNISDRWIKDNYIKN